MTELPLGLDYLSRRQTPTTPTRERKLGIGVFRFPQMARRSGGHRTANDGSKLSRRLVHRKALDDRGRFDGR